MTFVENWSSGQVTSEDKLFKSFMILYLYTAQGQQQILSPPRGDKLSIVTYGFVTLIIDKLFKDFMILYMYTAQGQQQILSPPRGDKFSIVTSGFVTFSH